MRRITRRWWVLVFLAVAFGGNCAMIPAAPRDSSTEGGLALIGTGIFVAALFAAMFAVERQNDYDRGYPDAIFWARCVVCQEWLRVAAFDKKMLPKIHESIVAGAFHFAAACPRCGANITAAIRATPLYDQMRRAAAHNAVAEAQKEVSGG